MRKNYQGKEGKFNEFCQQGKGLSFLYLHNKNGQHWWFPPGRFLHGGLEISDLCTLGSWRLGVFVRNLLAKYTLSWHVQGTLFIVFHAGYIFLWEQIFLLSIQEIKLSESKGLPGENGTREGLEGHFLNVTIELIDLCPPYAKTCTFFHWLLISLRLSSSLTWKAQRNIDWLFSFSSGL